MAAQHADEYIHLVGGDMCEDEFETVDELSRVSGVKCPEQLANLKGKQPRFTDICKKPEMTEVVFKMLGI